MGKHLSSQALTLKTPVGTETLLYLTELVVHLVLPLAVESHLVAFNRIMQYCTTDSAPNWQKLQDLTLQNAVFFPLRCSSLLLPGAEDPQFVQELFSSLQDPVCLSLLPLPVY